MSHDLEQIAAQLITTLADSGYPADRCTTGPGSAAINIWGESGRYPIATLTVSDSGNFHDYAWGPHYEHVLPLSTPPADVAAALIDTLPPASGPSERA